MLVAHISDFHIFSEAPETGLVRRDVADCARKIVADIAAFSPAFEAVLFTGDICDGGSDADYALLKDILAPIKVPVFPVPGNHDARGGFRRAFEGELTFASSERLDYVAKLGTARVIALDSTIPGRVEGALTKETLDWLEALLEDSSASHTFLLIHHPPFLSGIHGLDIMSLVRGAERLAALVHAYPASLSLLAGHIHRPFSGVWAGKSVAVGGSPAFQIALELTPAAPEPPAVNEPYGYMVHKVDGSGVVIHRRAVTL